MEMFSEEFLQETISILDSLDRMSIESVARGISEVRDRSGRLFVLGVGGSAAHASHAVNDFRKLCGIEAYAPTDNVSELTARTNDDGWDSTFIEWLRVSRLNSKDAILVFSVGGGDRDRAVSVNLVRALEFGVDQNAAIFGIVGRTGGFTQQVSNACVTIPPKFEERVTPHTEGICAVVWHLLVSHPLLARNQAKWESVR